MAENRRLHSAGIKMDKMQEYPKYISTLSKSELAKEWNRVRILLLGQNEDTLEEQDDIWTDRLTPEHPDNRWALKNVSWTQLRAGAVLTKDSARRLQEALEKLQEYEQTGFSPGQISLMREMNN